MEGFQFGEQTREAGTLLNREAGGGKGGADLGFRNIACAHSRHQMLWLLPHGGR